MVSGVGQAIDSMFSLMFLLLIIFVPLGVWKLIEIIIWCIKHISVSMS